MLKLRCSQSALLAISASFYGADFCGIIIVLMAKQKPRTYARNRSRSDVFFSRTGREKVYEKDSTFFLKLVICVVLGALWLRLKEPIPLGSLEIQGLPVGLIIALILVLVLEKYQFNRKIWYTVLILVAILSSFTPVGIII